MCTNNVLGIALHTVVIQRYIDINNVPILQLALIGYSMAYGLVDGSAKWDRSEGYVTKKFGKSMLACKQILENRDSLTVMGMHSFL